MAEPTMYSPYHREAVAAELMLNQGDVLGLEPTLTPAPAASSGNALDTAGDQDQDFIPGTAA